MERPSYNREGGDRPYRPRFNNGEGGGYRSNNGGGGYRPRYNNDRQGGYRPVSYTHLSVYSECGTTMIAFNLNGRFLSRIHFIWELSLIHISQDYSNKTNKFIFS